MKNIKEELDVVEFDFLWVLARNNINKERLITMSYDELKAIPTMGAEKICEIKRKFNIFDVKFLFAAHLLPCV